MITVKNFVFNMLGVNSYLLYDETKEAVLIDCGCIFPEEEKEFSDFLVANGLNLKRLLCTHLHFDHVLGNGFIYNTYQITPEAHRKEIELQPNVKDQIQSMGIPVPIQCVDVEKFLIDQEKITFGNSELVALLVPGHSPGSLAYYSSKDGFIIAGDVLFNGSIGRSDLWGGNHEVLIASIKDKILSLPDETIVYPGHGPSTSVIHEKFNNPFL